jgi:hypothetical protein
MNEEDLTRFRLCSSYQENSEGNLRNIPIKAQIFLVNYWYRSGQDEVYASVSPLGICGGSAQETRDNTPHAADRRIFLNGERFFTGTGDSLANSTKWRRRTAVLVKRNSMW